MTHYLVGDVTEFEEGGRKVVSCDGVEVGVFLIKGEFVAWFNSCAHMRGPVCQGRIYKRVLEPVAADGTVRFQDFSEEDIHIVCPWHGFEYNLQTGQHPGNPRVRLKRAQLEIADGKVHVVI